jgi:hypothetical protein
MASTQDISRAQTLISDLLDSAWEAEKPAKTPSYEQYMNVKSMDRGEFIDYEIAGVGKFVEREELTDVDYDELEFGDKLTVRPKNYARGFRVSEEFLEDIADAGVKDGANVAKLGSYVDLVRRWKRAATWTVEEECIDLLDLGTGTTKFTGRDSLALFSASHTTLKNPVVTQSNIDTGGALSATRIEAMTRLLDTQLDGRGDFIHDDSGYILVHGPAIRDRVYELFKTKGSVGNEYNNVNTMDQYDVQSVCVNYLGTSSVKYFLLKKNAHTLTWLWRVKPQFGKEADFDAFAQKYRARFRGVAFASDYRGVCSNAGAG